jgi:hypothetical protein
MKDNLATRILKSCELCWNFWQDGRAKSFHLPGGAFDEGPIEFHTLFIESVS